MTKLIFLDIDGVLNSRASIAMGVHLEAEKVILIDMLRKMAGEGTEVIISSTWRHMWELRDLQEILRVVGFRNSSQITGITPINMGSTCRGEQIQAVLDSRNDVEKYVIIDDDSDFLPHQLPYHVKTEVSVGFTRKEFEKALGILNDQSN